MTSLKAIDLFAGIGGIKTGLQRAGFDVVYSNDFDKYCKITFDANFKEKLHLKDIKNVQSEEIPDHDLLAAGFPCQPFSLAGLRKGFDDERGSLFFEVVRILEDKKPRAFLLENVKNLKNHNKGETLKKIIHFLEQELGYHVYYKVLNSKDFGLPQSRERIYIVGFIDKKEFEFPQPNENSATISDILEDNVDNSYFLSQQYYEGLALHKQRHKEKGGGFGFKVLDPNGISSALVVGNMGRERNLIQDKPRKGFYKEGMNKLAFKNKLGIRKLTIRECARLQGFPEEYIFPVSNSQAYKQLGNSVAIPVVEKVAKKIVESLLSDSSSSHVEDDLVTKIHQLSHRVSS